MPSVSSHPFMQAAAAVVALIAAVIGAFGGGLLIDSDPADGLVGIGGALRTVLGGAFLVMAAVVGVVAAVLWVVALRRNRRKTRALGQ